MLCHAYNKHSIPFTRTNAAGLAACEALLEGAPGPFCFGAAPTLADICLVPQVFNAKRVDCPLGDYPRLMGVFETCMKHAAFEAARPEKQPDAE